jgi:SAM-dependent methyltransferase
MDPEVSARATLHPSIVLSAYLEPIVRGRRVAVLGDATSGLADELGERGARLLHVYDPDPSRVAEALATVAPGSATQVGYALLAGDLGVRDGAFDVVVVPDLALFTDPADIMRRARRLVPSGGVAVFVAPNAEARGRRLVAPRVPGTSGTGAARAPGYYELFDLVSLQFARVRMIGQAPFVGYTIADFAPAGEPEVSVDTSLVAASEEPEHFIAVASDRPVPLDAYAVVALPWEEVAAAAADPEDLAHAEARAALLEGQVETLKQREARLDAAASRAAEEREASAARLADLDAELVRREARLKETEARAGDSHVRAERLANQIRDLDEELVRQRDRGTKLSKQLDEEKRARTKSEVELGMVRNKPEIAGAKDRIDALAAELEAARARIAELELEQTETRRRPVATERATERERIDELQKAVDEALRTAAEAAADRDAHGARVREGEGRLAASEARATDALRRLAMAEERPLELAAKVAVLEAELHAARTNGADVGEARTLAEAAASEVAALESALVERGHVVAALTRDLRESERIGKELLEELQQREASREASLGFDVSDVSSHAAAGEWRGRLDALAMGAARTEADLQAATWRIAQLERELAEARRLAPEPAAVQLELEEALAAARDEVASLRRALGTSAS